jgi:hypothetical protein
MVTIETLKDWTLELGGQEYSAASLSIIPWPILRNLAQEKVKLLRLQEQQVAQKSLIWRLEQDVVKLAQNESTKE